VETSTSGSKMVATKIAVELLQGLRYKLRMVGIPLDSPTNLRQPAGKMSAIRNTGTGSDIKDSVRSKDSGTVRHDEKIEGPSGDKE
jgi:hypothetical protein